MNNVAEPIKDNTSTAYKFMKSKILSLHKTVKHAQQLTTKEATKQEIKKGNLTESKIFLIEDTIRIKNRKLREILITTYPT